MYPAQHLNVRDIFIPTFEICKPRILQDKEVIFIEDAHPRVMAFLPLLFQWPFNFFRNDFLILNAKKSRLCTYSTTFSIDVDELTQCDKLFFFIINIISQVNKLFHSFIPVNLRHLEFLLNQLSYN